MLGQTRIIEQLKSTKARSVLVTGPAHWGKKTLLRELFKNEESVYEISGNAATFREALDRIYQTARPTVYLIPDIDKTNATIQNVLLKVLEEPPLSARFYLTASGSVLPTITSRCVTYRMEPYKDTNAELGGLNAPPCLLGMFHSPGELAMLNVPGIDSVVQQLCDIKNNLASGCTLAFALKLTRDLNRSLHEVGLSHEALLILIREVIGESPALDWLRSLPEDSVRYARTQYVMKLWLEREVLS